ncbi:MAG: glycosyltransferase family 2 protein [Nitrospirota bacterium]
MQQENLLVSIIVRTKDRPALLRRALKSIAAQTYRPIEVVLVNDGGCDLDVEELGRILGNASLNYIRLRENRGRARAGNTGIENARGDYIGFLDDDDEFYPEHISTLMSFLKDSEYRIAYTDSLMVYARYHDSTGEMEVMRKEVMFSHDFDFDLLVFENYIPLLCLLFARETVLSVSGFDESFDLYEDWDMLIRLGEIQPFHHIRKTTAEYSQWSLTSQISQWNMDSDLLKQACLRVLNKHLHKFTALRIHDHLSRSLVVKKLEQRINQLRETEKEGQRLEELLQAKEQLVSEIMNTRGWRLLQHYRHIRDGFRALYSGKTQGNLLLKGLKTLKTQGLKALVFKMNKKLLFSQSIKQPNPVDFSSLPVRSVSGSDIVHPLESRISVIIPTKNAGRDFEYILQKISRQEGIREIELLIIDSGSGDGTVDIAKKYTEHVFQVSPDEFHHAKTRNFGAEMATGEFLVFTVQDAIPAGAQWLYKLVSPLSAGEASAVSARQIPRSDADLFAGWSYWDHDLRYLGNDRERISQVTPEAFLKLSLQEKRSLACLDNVCLGIAKKTFDTYRFRAGYAEDFELGMRMISEGHPLMFQSSNAVIHSHSRPPVYYFRRSCADTLIMADILQTEHEEIDEESVTGAISYCYAILKAAIDELHRDRNLPTNPEKLVHVLLNLLYDKMTWFNPSWQNICGDQLLDEYFRNIRPGSRKEIVSELYSEMAGKLYRFSQFMRAYADIQPFGEDFTACLYKIFSVTAGNFLGRHSQIQSKSLCGGI